MVNKTVEEIYMAYDEAMKRKWEYMMDILDMEYAEYKALHEAEPQTLMERIEKAKALCELSREIRANSMDGRCGEFTAPEKAQGH